MGARRPALVTAGALAAVATAAFAAAFAASAPSQSRAAAVGTPATPEDFHYAADRAEGERPLLTIVMNFSDRDFDAAHTPTFYRRLLFATSEGRLIGSVAGRGSIFDEMSEGRFFYVNAGVVGVYTHPDTPSTPSDESKIACAVDQIGSGCKGNERLIRSKAIATAAKAGFDFARYDADRDGCVRTDELTILMVFAGRPEDSRRGGSAEGGDRVVKVGDGLRTCSRTVGVGEAVSSSTIAHELSHTLGTIDVYGGSFNNQRYSLMGPTIFIPEDERSMFHLDPYHKLRLGWLRPTIVPIDGRVHCLDLRATEERDGSAPKAYLLYDESRGTREFFLLEHRLPRELNYDGDPFLTGSFSLPGQGLVGWYVKTDDDGIPLVVPNIRGRSASDRALYVIPPGRARPGLGAAWGAGVSGDLKWLALDGTAAGTRALAVSVKSRDVGRPVITIRVAGEGDGPCEIASIRGPEPGTLPAPGAAPCPIVGGQVVCRINVIGAVAVRRTPAKVKPNECVTVSWTVTRTERRARSIVVRDSLPPGWQGKAQSLAFGTPALGKPVTKTHRVCAPLRMGRYALRGFVQVRPNGKGTPKRVAFVQAVFVYAAGRVAVHGPEELPPPPDPDPPAPPPAAKPDLVVTAVSSTSVTVRNQGNAPAGAFTVRIQAAQTQNLAFSGLAAGTSATRTFAGACAKAGDPIAATADIAGQVDESDESNNGRTGTC